MASIRPIPGKPGHFVDSNGEVIILTEAREADRYDTENLASGALTAGTKLTLFTDLTNKNELDANFPEANKLVTGAERLVMEWIGYSVQQSNATNITSGKDIKRHICHGYLLFKLNKLTVDEGPLERFPSGYGLSGNTVQNDGSVINNGVPATQSVRPLKELQMITDEHTVKCSVEFQSRTWLTTSTLPTMDAETAGRCYVHGILESAATNN